MSDSNTSDDGHKWEDNDVMIKTSATYNGPGEHIYGSNDTPEGYGAMKLEEATPGTYTIDLSDYLDLSDFQESELKNTFFKCMVRTKQPGASRMSRISPPLSAAA